NRTVVSLRPLCRHHPLRWCPQEPHLRSSSRSPSGLPLLLDWRSTSPTSFFCRSAGTRVPATRLIGCIDFHQACSGRAGGVTFVVHHTFPCERLSLLEPTAWRPPPSACAHRPAPAYAW
ncbi:hypothetical protein TcCL_NonESM11118, partial [Trypanosoma cruzi]